MGIGLRRVQSLTCLHAATHCTAAMQGHQRNHTSDTIDCLLSELHSNAGSTGCSCWHCLTPCSCCQVPVPCAASSCSPAAVRHRCARFGNCQTKCWSKGSRHTLQPPGCWRHFQIIMQWFSGPSQTVCHYAACTMQHRALSTSGTFSARREEGNEATPANQPHNLVVSCGA